MLSNSRIIVSGSADKSMIFSQLNESNDLSMCHNVEMDQAGNKNTILSVTIIETFIFNYRFNLLYQ